MTGQGQVGDKKTTRATGDYLRKQAASEEVGQPVTLTGDSYTDLRRNTGEERQMRGGGRNNKNNNKMENTKNIMGLMGKNQTWSVRTKNERYKEEEQ